MSKWTNLSIEYANQRSYLDDLFQVYPTIPEGIREINEKVWADVEKAFKRKNNGLLIRELLKLDLFPIKDSYIAYLKRDSSSIDRNPRTINRLCGRLYELGLDKLYERCSEPKETNRQIGPMFKDWVRSKALGIAPVGIEEFINSSENAILDASDKVMSDFAKERLNYRHEKGLDLVARFNGKYVIGEAKFLTDFGGHQNAQLEDAILTLTEPNVDAIQIAILDGVVWLKSQNKMYKTVTEKYGDKNIMSALLLREFLYQI